MLCRRAESETFGMNFTVRPSPIAATRCLRQGGPVDLVRRRQAVARRFAYIHIERI
jgi:hypothetical protein